MAQLVRSTLSFLFFSLFAANAWAAGYNAGRLPLVEVFCSNAVDSVPSWEAMVQSLEQRQSLKKSDASPDRMKLVAECVEKHRTEFDEAEFYFDGKNLVESETSQPEATIIPDSQKNDLTVSLLGLVIKASEAAAGLPSPFAEEERLARAEKYNQLWNGFLGGLKERLRQSRADAKILN